MEGQGTNRVSTNWAVLSLWLLTLVASRLNKHESAVRLLHVGFCNHPLPPPWPCISMPLGLDPAPAYPMERAGMWILTSALPPQPRELLRQMSNVTSTLAGHPLAGGSPAPSQAVARPGLLYSPRDEHGPVLPASKVLRVTIEGRQVAASCHV